jgi:hypothetical protein
MKKNLIESWITTVIGIFIAIFGGLIFWFDKSPLWGTVIVWVVSAMFIFADEVAIKGLLNKIPKLK